MLDERGSSEPTGGSHPGSGRDSGRDGGFVGFFTSLPGILTAIAAVVTAVGGMYVAVHKGGGDNPPSAIPSGPMVVLNLTQPAGEAPVVNSNGIAEINLSGFDTAESSPVDDAVAELVNDCADGDDAACVQLLDMLVDECDTGYGVSCDVLYWVSDEGADYEYFGATCGGRFPEGEYAGECDSL